MLRPSKLKHRSIIRLEERWNEQTLDAFSLALSPLPEWLGTEVRLANVKRIFGARHPMPEKANTRMGFHLIHPAHGGFPGLKVSVYSCPLDFKNSPEARCS